MEIYTNPFFTESEVQITENFGLLTIHLLPIGGFSLNMKALDLYGKILLEHTLMAEDLEFNDKAL